MTPPETRTRLIEVAEQLFADEGVSGASMRDITSAAGTNLGAVNYHFGSKDGLLRAIVVERGSELNDERLRLLELAEVAAADGSVHPRAILQAFLDPVFDMRKKHPHFPRLLGRVLNENLMATIGDVFRETFYETLLRFVEALHEARPDLPKDEIRWRLLFTVGSFHFTVCGHESVEAVTGESHSEESLQDLRDRLLTFCVSGIAAPATGGAPMDPALKDMLQ